jgi:hypothetical protein
MGDMDSNIVKHKAPRVKLKPSINKILAAICHVISEAEKCHFAITQYDIVKTIFLADKSHLNTYGRPITFDNYAAMIHGSVPSLVYDLLKGNAKSQNELKKQGIKTLGWKKTKASHIAPNCFIYTLDGPAKTQVLSVSDKHALTSALGTVKSLGFSQIRKLTHEDPAYLEAWKEDGLKITSYPMSYGMLFEAPDYEAAERIQYFSQCQ